MGFLFHCDFLFNIRIITTKTKYFDTHIFVIIEKNQFLGSENICTCRMFFYWLFWVNLYTLVKSGREYIKIFKKD